MHQTVRVKFYKHLLMLASAYFLLSLATFKGALPSELSSWLVLLLRLGPGVMAFYYATRIKIMIRGDELVLKDLVR